MTAKSHRFVNLEYLDMMTEGDPSMRETMIVMLLDELPTEISEMRPLADIADWRELREVSHKMKSTLAFIGNDAMTEANREIENITKNESTTSREKTLKLIGVLELHLTCVMADLEDCLNA